MRKSVVLLLIVMVVLFVGCATADYAEKEDAVLLDSMSSVRIYTWHDDSLNVTCWYFVGDREGGMSCVPDWQLNPPIKCE